MQDCRVKSKGSDVLDKSLNASEPMKYPTDRRLGSGREFTQEVHAPRLEDLTSPKDILEAMACMTTGARALANAACVLSEMFKECELVVLTLSGVASVGRLDYLISELIDMGHIKCVIATGAVVTHGCSYEMGANFFHIDQEQVDEQVDVNLYNRGYNRIYDTVELEKSLENTGDLVCSILSNWEGDSICSADIHYELGRILNKKFPKEDGLLHACSRNDVSLIVPSYTDSEIGLSHARYLIECPKAPKFDPFLDLTCYAKLIKDSFSHGPLGILTLGGGVPRNWAQQIGPFYDTLMDRGIVKLTRPIRFKYGVRICPEFREWGGLSGCTYSEGISWGKFVPTKEGGRYAEVYSDYTSVFPLLISGVLNSRG